MLKITLPSKPIGDRLIQKLKNSAPVILAIGRETVKDLQQNIASGSPVDPDTGAALKALSSRTIARKKLIGAFLTVLRETDAMRKGISVIDAQSQSVKISVTGKAKAYFFYHVEERPFLGFSPESRRKAKLRISEWIKK